MLRRPDKMTQILQAGGPFIGENAACTRIAVAPNWWLKTSNGPVGNFPHYKLPIRWWQDQAGSETLVEVPNLKTVIIDRQLSQDAATIEVDFYNTATPANGVAGDNPDVFGRPGWLAWNYGGTPLSKQKWGQTPNAWRNILRENCLLYVWQGYGGWTDPATGNPLTITEAVAAGNIMLTGVFLIDSIAIEADGQSGGMGKLIGRDMAKLLIDQPLYPPCVPASFYNYGATQGFGMGAGITYFRDRPVVFPKALGYAAPGETSPLVDQTSPLEGFPLYVDDMAPYIGGDGYWVVGSDGGVFSYGYAYFQGSEGDTHLAAQMVSIDSTAGQGYWCASQDGGVFAFGDAPFLGNAVGHLTSETIVALRRTQSGRGYWLCSNKGNVFSYGDAAFHGSLGGTDTIVGFTPRPQGDGYWLLAASGAVYSYGAAAYYGGANPLSGDTAAGIDSDALGTGYRIVTKKGVVSAYGSAQMYTVTSGNPVYQIALNAPISAIRRTPSDRGWWLVGQDGGVFTYGDAQFWGSMPGDFTAHFAGTYKDYCVDEETEALTKRGWLRHNEIREGDEVLGIDADTYRGRWHKVESVYRKHRKREMVAFKGASFDALTTPDHRWLTRFGESHNRIHWTTSDAMTTGDRIPLAVPSDHLPTEPTYSDAFVELIAWFWTEGTWSYGRNGEYVGCSFSQSQHKNPENCSIIREMLHKLYGEPGPMPRGAASLNTDGPWWNETQPRPDSSVIHFRLAKRVADSIRAVCDPDPDKMAAKVISTAFLLTLTQHQLELYITRSLLADASCNKDRRRAMLHHASPERAESIGQRSEDRTRSFEIACILAGQAVTTHCRTYKGKEFWDTTLLKVDETALVRSARMKGRTTITRERYDGIVWCPQTELGNFVARRNGAVYVTGNSDIVEDITLWAGFWLEGNTPSNASPTVFGLIEGTGAYNAVGPIDSSLFDKVQCIDAIKSIRDIMGWIFRIREDGSVQFSAPNIWTMGNFYLDNTPTSYIPVFDEKLNITSYIQTNTDASMRSSIMVSAEDPYKYGGTPGGQTVTVLVPPNLQSLHGMVKPAMIGIPLYVPISYADQDLMAELQAIQCWLGIRAGQLTAGVDPGVCIDDQIQIFERSSGETGIHYVTGVHTEHDLDTGTFQGTYSTVYLGEPSNWAITTGTNGTLTDTTFDANGNVNYQDSFPISQNLLNFLASQGSSRTQHFKVGYVDGTGNATAVVPGVM